jgi:hypothetical protein
LTYIFWYFGRFDFRQFQSIVSGSLLQPSSSIHLAAHQPNPSSFNQSPAILILQQLPLASPLASIIPAGLIPSSPPLLVYLRTSTCRKPKSPIHKTHGKFNHHIKSAMNCQAALCPGRIHHHHRANHGSINSTVLSVQKQTRKENKHGETKKSPCPTRITHSNHQIPKQKSTTTIKHSQNLHRNSEPVLCLHSPSPQKFKDETGKEELKKRERKMESPAKKKKRRTQPVPSVAVPPYPRRIKSAILNPTRGAVLINHSRRHLQTLLADAIKMLCSAQFSHQPRSLITRDALP